MHFLHGGVLKLMYTIRKVMALKHITQQVKQAKVKPHCNFDWMLEATEENLNLLLEEVYNRFMSATGKTATEAKLDKIEKYGEEHNLKVYEELPKGWKRINCLCTTWKRSNF